MKMHYKERLQDVLAWPWKLFCALWAELIDWAAEEEARKQERHVENEWARLKQQSQSGG